MQKSSATKGQSQNTTAKLTQDKSTTVSDLTMVGQCQIPSAKAKPKQLVITLCRLLAELVKMGQSQNV
jgi:hypothetical protein